MAILVAVVAVLALMLAGLAAVALRTGSSASRTGRLAAPSPSPTRTPLSGDAYQVLLSQLDAALGPPLQALSDAQTIAALAQTAYKLEETITVQIWALEAVTAPTAVQAAHRDLLVALGDLRDKTQEFGPAFRIDSICRGSTALAQITQSPAATGLRAAAQEFVTADPTRAYHVGAFLPAPIPDSNRRPDNGTMVKKIAQRGPGKFDFKNSSTRDIAVTLAPVGSSTATFIVYVQGNAQYTVSGVRDGDYKVFLSMGEDWDPNAKGFTRNCHHEVFPDTFKFTTTSRTATVWHLELGVTSGGNTEATEVESVPT